MQLYFSYLVNFLPYDNQVLQYSVNCCKKHVPTMLSFELSISVVLFE